MTAEMEPLGNGLVELMVWVYAEDVYRFVPSYTWDRFSEVFDTIWTASAFKGAHGPQVTTPDVKKHLTNHINWLDLMRNEESKFKDGFRGIALTGWQRYVTCGQDENENRNNFFSFSGTITSLSSVSFYQPAFRPCLLIS